MWSVQRIEVIFEADGLDSVVVRGTGFWMNNENRASVFITNRHNLDAKLQYGEHTPFRPKTISIELRRRCGDTFFQKTQWYEVAIPRPIIHETADAAILVNPQMLIDGKPTLADFGFYPILRTDIADQEFLINSVAPMNIASFVGFPGTSENEWSDRRWRAPIARTVNIASIPSIPFEHEQILTSDTMLVSGLSFSGASGSPVFLHQQGIKGGVGIISPYVEPKVVGIMSGHWNQKTSSGMLEHSGLSYLTRSTAIQEMLSKAGL